MVKSEKWSIGLPGKVCLGQISKDWVKRGDRSGLLVGDLLKQLHHNELYSSSDTEYPQNVPMGS